MKRILLSVVVACVLSTDAFAYQGVVDGGQEGTMSNPNDTKSYSAKRRNDNVNYLFNNNTITINSGNSQHNYDNIYGVYTSGDKGEKVYDNRVEMHGGTANNLYGAYASNNSAEKNFVIMFGGTANNLYGASGDGRADLQSNGVIMNGGVVEGNVYGTYGRGLASSVEIFDGVVKGNVYGIYGGGGANSVLIYGGTIEGNVYGVYGVGAGINLVTHSGGIIKGDIYGGYAVMSKRNNVIISGGSIDGFVYGGYADSTNSRLSARIKADENSVTISGGTINKDVYGGYAKNGSATGNIVTYSGGIIKGDIYGGFAPKSTNNKLIISGINLSANSIKESTFQIYSFSLPASIKANDTMLKLTNPLKFEASDTLEFNAQGKLDALKLNDTITLVDNVTNYLTGKYYILAEYNSAAVKYYYGFNLEVINDGLTATLINNNGLKEPEVQSNGPVLLAAKGAKGTNNSIEDWKKLGYTLEEIKEILQALNGMDDVGNAIKVVASDEAKSLSEGAAAAMATLNSAGDTIAGKATENAMANAGNSSLGGNSSIGSFGAIGAGANRYKTGSYVDSKSVNLVAGIALGKELDYGKLVVGPFIEFGYSDYETHNDFSSGHVKGDGDSKYYGIGALTRFDFNDFKGSRPYLEFSARFGRNKNDFSNDIGADYDVSSNYYGLHAGLGYIIASGANKFDIYAKYFYTHLNSADTTLKTGESFSFDAVKSHKTRLGVKYSREVELANGSIISPYIGAGWEKEYSGDAKATTTPAGSSIGLAVSAPSLKGNSAMAEIGINIGKDKGFKADIGLMGYAGIHRGVNANLILQYEF